MKHTITAMTLAILLGLGMGLSISPPAGAETLYRWVDERGDPVHSDRPPPPGVDYEVISTGSTLRRPVEGSEGAVPLELEPTPSNQFEPVDDGQPASTKNPEFCQRARDNLDALDTRVRIRVRNEDGEFRFIDEAEKQERRREAQDAIDKYCE